MALLFLSVPSKTGALSTALYVEEAVLLLKQNGFEEIALKLRALALPSNIERLRRKVSKYETACRQNSKKACLSLLDIYEPEAALQDKMFSVAIQGCEYNLPKACHKEAMFYLGTKRGIYVPKDLARAYALNTKACSDKNGEACFHAGWYHRKKWMYPDREKAIHYYAQACDLKVEEGCQRLAELYHFPDNDTTPRDIEKAKKYYKKACQLGGRRACYALEGIKE